MEENKVILSQLKSCKRVLYALLLEDNYIYVGQTMDDYERRIRKHFNGKGSSWTKVHKPLEVLEVTSFFGDYREGEYKENDLTVEYMKKYGIDHVRGGFFSNVDNTGLRKNLVHHGYNVAEIEGGVIEEKRIFRLEHVLYEFEMFLFAYFMVRVYNIKLQEKGVFEGLQQLEYNCVLEDFEIHARNLLELFSNKRKLRNEIRINELLIDYIDIQVNWYKNGDYEKKLNKYYDFICFSVDHLSSDRADADFELVKMMVIDLYKAYSKYIKMAVERIKNKEVVKGLMEEVDTEVVKNIIMNIENLQMLLDK